MTLGNKIAYYRKNLNVTQDALAQQLGVTKFVVGPVGSGITCRAGPGTIALCFLDAIPEA